MCGGTPSRSVLSLLMLDTLRNLGGLVFGRGDSLVNELTGLGGMSDKGASYSPARRRRMSSRALDDLYSTNGYAARLVDKPAEDATSHGWRILDGSAANSDPMRQLDEDLGTWASMGEAMRCARHKGGAIVLMVVDEIAPGYDENGFNESGGHILELPLDPSKVTEFQNLVVFDDDHARAVSWVDDLADKSFRQPSMWEITSPSQALSSGAVGGAATNGLRSKGSLRVHHSRVLYIPGKRTTAKERHARGGWDLSILESLWDQIRNITGAEQATATLFQELKIDVVKIGGMDAMSTTQQCEYFEQRMQLLATSKAVGGVVLLAEGEEYAAHSATLAGLDKAHDIFKSALCAVSGMPRVTLFGDAPGGLNSDGESHRELHQSAIDAIQKHALKEALTKFYTAVYGSQASPSAEPSEWRLEFHPIYTPTTKTQAETEKLHAETDAIRIQSEVVTPRHVTESRFSKQGYQSGLMPVDTKQLDEMEEAKLQGLRAEMEAQRAAAEAQSMAPDTEEETDGENESDEVPEDSRD